MHGLVDPTVLFFVLGAFAGLARSNLEFPAAISRFLAMYLLVALGLKGGFALAESGVTAGMASSLGIAVLLAVVVPLMGYWLLRRVVSGFDAAAVAATYGSVSAVTFVTATQYLETHAIAYGGYMAAAMALMESPAILIGVLVANTLRHRLSAQAATAGGPATTPGLSIGRILHDSLTDGTQLLLLGALVIGIVTGHDGKVALQPFFGNLFKGVLCLFLLDMGVVATRRLSAVKSASRWLLAYAVLGPLVHAGLALGLALWLRVPAGDAVLLMVLAASASYIAVPAVVRYAVPEAEPSLYVGLSLGVTFPLNIVLGIPLYARIVQRIWLP
ncbi:sodium-dependent bicarbonate transport family permease [Sphingomonas sp. NCPPB 2930]